MYRLLSAVIPTLSSLALLAIQDPKADILARYLANNFSKEGVSITYVVTSTAPSSNNLKHYYGIQTLDGLPVYGGEFNAAMKDNKVVSLKHAFKIGIANAPKTGFTLTPGEAFRIIKPGTSFSGSFLEESTYGSYTLRDVSISDEDIRINKMWVYEEGNAIAVYEVSMYEKDHSHWYNTRINASTGDVINRNDWVTECLFHNTISDATQLTNPQIPAVDEIQHTNKMSAGGTYTVFNYPLESPNHGSRTKVTGAENKDASPYGWHDIDGVEGAEFTITRGNNVRATEDRDADNAPGNAVDGGSALVFDNPFDIDQSASLFVDASITNLFFWNNLLHDVWWHYGFDEASGNFQQNNYGNGGVGGDYVNADAQDGSGTNNANFATPPDGTNPRMQMFLWGNGASSADYFQVNSPSAIAQKYRSNTAGFGPELTSVPITGNLVLVDDGSANSDQGCTTLTNANDINGNIALVRRRSCNFTVKVKNAQLAGAKAVVIYSDDENPIQMGGNDNTITIPSVLITQSAGQAILAEMQNTTVSVSLYDSSDNSSVLWLDSDFDNGIITHEYGHGISVRLTGGAANSSCLTNVEQMGEGWSDFFGLVMTHEAGDKGSDSRGIGTYARKQSVNGPGIRPHPYSTDKSISPYNYDDIKNTSYSAPHGIGSIWCSMLWDLYWAMIDKHGYDSNIYTGTGGNNKAMQLVIDGLKLQKCNPGFVDGRDAILEADMLNYGGENEELIWEVFADRGLGFKASQGSSNDRFDGFEDYTLPPYLNQLVVLNKYTEPKATNDSLLTYSLEVTPRKNVTPKDLVIIDVLDDEVILLENSLQCDNISVSGNAITWNLDSLEYGDTMTCDFTVRVIKDRVSSQLWTEDAEEDSTDWESVSELGDSSWVKTNKLSNSGALSWYILNQDEQSDYSLYRSINLIDVDQPILSFYHFYNSEESWDGGVVEIKRSGEGENWLDAGDYFVSNGYNTRIQQNDDSRISERPAFSGNSDSFILSQLDLTSFAGEEIELRFRFVSDAASSEEGWYIDDITLEDASVLENTATATYSNGTPDTATVITTVYGEPSTFGLGIFVPEPNDIEVYPNPATHIINIKSGDQNQYTYELLTMDGKQLVSGAGEVSSIIRTNDLTPGVFILAVTKKGVRKNYKLLLK
jgi:hypothetical protein